RFLMSKQDLIFSPPLMNASGTLGFTPNYRSPVPWEEFGTFVTNPLSLRPRKPTTKPALIEYPGGFLIHTGLPNPGLAATIKKFGPRWQKSKLPIIAHLMADRPEETQQMVRALEDIDNIAAVELGFAPLLANDIILLTVEMSLGELPLIVSLPAEQILLLGAQVINAGATALSLASPRGMLNTENGDQVTGRINGPGLFPQALLTVRDAVQSNLPIIGAGGVGTKVNADAMLAVGALAVQADANLWKGDVSVWALTP
ncbi:MAG: hypothetical protein QGM50_12390, partial [Anaerolineae bacterium]|nr:hypothetical protein [Anaerolineae bacterium]